MQTSDLLSPERIDCGLEASSKKRALELVAEALARGPGGLDEAAVIDSLVSRERLGSTAVGHGVALPHGRVEGLAGSRGAFLRLGTPVDFEADDGQPVDLVFGLIVPVACDDEHLAALAAVAARFDDAAMRDALRATTDREHALALLVG